MDPWGKAQASQYSSRWPGTLHLDACYQRTQVRVHVKKEKILTSHRTALDSVKTQGFSFTDVVYTILESIVFQILLTVILNKLDIFMGSQDE